ncbi:hypothetical protein M427DRAFT_239371 [Gonapodya prolifera JEL478]|uniref:Uncharacterized protein n=1 Tax=Gonapodya prolifera (strain JEL478) TaxID=1344416 RepID=A0A138ZXR0_GONPJ|nr:hypothetical protein M427DRAFT_239371 [Gonapodya prolifera JEL478]|eukprot:KXS09292.1 hypothetical protein M427DRAFT_239371 [Gonapodya prolifera JEL478]
MRANVPSGTQGSPPKRIIVAVIVPLILGLLTTTHALPRPEHALKKSSASELAYLHLTDLHMDPYYVPDSDPQTACHRGTSEAATAVAPRKGRKRQLSSPGHFGMRGSQCDSPVVLVEDTFSFIKGKYANFSLPPSSSLIGKYPPQPQAIDFVLWTGDSSRHDRDSKMPRKYKDIVDANSRIVSLFSNTFNLSSSPVIPTLGNWEVYPSDDLDPSDSPALLKDIWNLWLPLFDDLRSSEKKVIKQTFLTGGYFSRTIRSASPDARGLKVVSLNTVWVYVQNSKVDDCPKPKSHKTTQQHPATPMFDWFRSTLMDARASNYSVLIISHIPPLDVGTPLYKDNCLATYTSLVGEFSDVILGSTHGHTNKDTVTFVTTTKNGYDMVPVPSPGPRIAADSIVGMAWTAPSVYPVFNPGFRVGRLSTVDGWWTINGWTQWFANIADENDKFDELQSDNDTDPSYHIKYKIEYDTTVEYRMPNLSPNAYSTWYRSFQTNSGGLADYYSRFVVVGATSTVAPLGISAAVIATFSLILFGVAGWVLHRKYLSGEAPVEAGETRPLIQ